MRPPLYFTLILVLALAVLSWRNQRRISDLETQQTQVAGQARAGGWLVDERAPDGLVRSSGRARPDRAAAARQAAAALVSYAREFPQLDSGMFGDKQRRAVLETERVQQLDGTQLKIVIGELRAAADLDSGIRDSLLAFTLEQLSQTHPRDALTILLELRGQRKFDKDASGNGRRPLATVAAEPSHYFRVGQKVACQPNAGAAPTLARRGWQSPPRKRSTRWLPGREAGSGQAWFCAESFF